MAGEAGCAFAVRRQPPFGDARVESRKTTYGKQLASAPRFASEKTGLGRISIRSDRHPVDASLLGTPLEATRELTLACTVDVKRRLHSLRINRLKVNECNGDITTLISCPVESRCYLSREIRRFSGRFKTYAARISEFRMKPDVGQNRMSRWRHREQLGRASRQSRGDCARGSSRRRLFACAGKSVPH